MSSHNFSPVQRFEPVALPLSFDISLEDALKHYRDYIKVELGLAESTIHSYSSWMNHFRKWLASVGQPSPTLAIFNQAILTSYLHYLHGKKLRPRTIHAAFFPLRGMGELLIVRGLTHENIAKKVQLPKKDAAIRLTITDDEVKSLLDACGKIRNSKRSALASATISILAFAGLRRSEVLALCVGDVSFTDGSILVRSGKGSKSRRVFPSDQCLSMVMNWVAIRGGSGDDPLLVGGGGREMGEKSLLTLLDEVKCIAGMRGEGRVCMHAIRHNCATRLLRNGADLGQIQQFLGHSSIQTTEIYLHTGEEDIRGIADKTGFRTPPIEAPQPQRETAVPQQRSIRSSVQQKRQRRN